MAMTATILMSANQNSNSPNSLTPNRLSSVMSTRKNAASFHTASRRNSPTSCMTDHASTTSKKMLNSFIRYRSGRELPMMSARNVRYGTL